MHSTAASSSVDGFAADDSVRDLEDEFRLRWHDVAGTGVSEVPVAPGGDVTPLRPHPVGAGDPLGDDLRLHLSEGSDHGRHELARRRGRIHEVRDTDDLGAPFLHPLDQAMEVERVPCESRDRVRHDDVNISGIDRRP